MGLQVLLGAIALRAYSAACAVKGVWVVLNVQLGARLCVTVTLGCTSHWWSWGACRCVCWGCAHQHCCCD